MQFHNYSSAHSSQVSAVQATRTSVGSARNPKHYTLQLYTTTHYRGSSSQLLLPTRYGQPFSMTPLLHSCTYSQGGEATDSTHVTSVSRPRTMQRRTREATLQSVHGHTPSPSILSATESRAAALSTVQSTSWSTDNAHAHAHRLSAHMPQRLKGLHS